VRRGFALRRAPIPGAPPGRAEALAKAERFIDLGWSVAALWALTRMAGALLLSRGSPVLLLLYLVDPALAGGLAYGLYRRSRVCAALLLVLVAAELYLAYAVTGRPAGVGVALILELSFLTGLRGALRYHRLLRDEAVPAGNSAANTEQAHDP
jgi:hypothetical protein